MQLVVDGKRKKLLSLILPTDSRCRHKRSTNSMFFCKSTKNGWLRFLGPEPVMELFNCRSLSVLIVTANCYWFVSPFSLLDCSFFTAVLKLIATKDLVSFAPVCCHFHRPNLKKKPYGTTSSFLSFNNIFKFLAFCPSVTQAHT